MPEPTNSPESPKIPPVPVTRLEDLTVLNDLRARLAEVTDEMIDWSQPKLSPIREGETDLGPVSRATRALYVLRGRLYSEMRIEQQRAVEPIDPILAKDHGEKGMFASCMEDVVEEMLWVQARMDTGYWTPETGIGLRQGWRLCWFSPPENPLAKVLERLTGSGSGSDFREV